MVGYVGLVYRLNMDDSELGERVEAWLEQAVEAGALDEVEGWRAAA